jgi:hypothetical protein
MQSQDQPQLPRPISRITFFRGCSEQTQTEMLKQMQIREGDMLSDELLQRAREVAQAFNPRFEVHATPVRTREEFLKLPEELRNRLTPPTCDDAVNVAIYDPASFPQRIRVEASVQDSMLIEKVSGGDPPQGETGAVQLTVVVGKDGSVIDVSPLGGPQSLIDSAIAAVRGWRYRPTLLNGRPVEIQTSVEVSFLSP